MNLALQGGGSHGAFTWGVLDHLLEDARLDIEAITDAGAFSPIERKFLHTFFSSPFQSMATQ